MKKKAPLRIRDMAPSRGEKLFKRKHRGHKPANIVPFRPRAVKVVSMFNALCERGWSFTFKVEALSPGKWKYSGEGSTAEEAFLKAFRLWEKDMALVVQQIPATLRKAKAEEALKRKYARTGIKHLIQELGPKILTATQTRPKAQPSPDAQVNKKREY